MQPNWVLTWLVRGLRARAMVRMIPLERSRSPSLLIGGMRLDRLKLFIWIVLSRILTFAGNPFLCVG